jgi:four helix bundle protein
MDQDELKQRTKEFAKRILKLVRALPRDEPGRVIAYQLAKAGTSVAANYRAACRGRSKAEFVAKLGTVEEEADESAFWMEIIVEDGMLKESLVRELLVEANELTAIIVSSRKTAKRK